MSSRECIAMPLSRTRSPIANMNGSAPSSEAGYIEKNAANTNSSALGGNGGGNGSSLLLPPIESQTIVGFKFQSSVHKLFDVDQNGDSPDNKAVAVVGSGEAARGKHWWPSRSRAFRSKRDSLPESSWPSYVTAASFLRCCTALEKGQPVQYHVAFTSHPEQRRKRSCKKLKH
ncbi:hypothetical protein MRX96_015666 [Rhipicephalus microplus]